jgi:Tol biopolymer transport system component
MLYSNRSQSYARQLLSQALVALLLTSLSTHASYAANPKALTHVAQTNNKLSSQSQLPATALPANGQIAFTSYRDGNAEIYVMNADGGGQMRLTNNSARDSNPAWSPDGTKLAFVTDRNVDAEIYVMNADGSNQTRLAGGVRRGYITSLTWLPDGTKLAFTGLNGTVLINADGSNQTPLNFIAFNPDWSPAGTQIASWTFTGTGTDTSTGIVLSNADGSNRRLITDRLVDTDPAWSPDGTRLAITRGQLLLYDLLIPNGRIYTINADASSPSRLTAFDSGSPAWSPDGAQIVFIGGQNGFPFGQPVFDIYVMNNNGSGQTKLTGTGNNYEPVWQPLPPTPQASIQFSAADFQAAENSVRATITVTRTGDTSGLASVNYQTVDTDTFTVGCSDTVNNHGAAYARCDFATTVGALSFAAGETTKSFTVPIIDDAIIEGGETFQIKLTNAAGATIGPPVAATVTIEDNDTASAPNPIRSSPFFVRQQYLDFLAREPEQEGFNAWLRVLNNCPDVNNIDPNSPAAGCDRILVSQSFFGSPEFQLKGFYVFRFYKLAFNRLPEYPEIVSDMSFVVGATAQEVFQRKAQLVVNFTQRPEFQLSFGPLSNSDYVTALLNRYQLTQITTTDPANPDGTAKVTLTSIDLVGKLNSNVLTRAQVFRAIADSDQVRGAEFNNAFVAMQYYGYLRRKPEPAGYQAWLRILQGGDVRTMVNGFLNSTEYKLRFGNPTQ